MSGYSVYKRNNSPYWWIAYHSPAKGKRVAESSGCLVKDRTSYGRALAQARKLGEEGRAAKLTGGDAGWDSWVEKWLQQKHAQSPRSLAAETHRWQFVAEFLALRKIYGPAGVSYKLGLEFLDWRQSHKTRTGKGGFNNALQELQLFARVMREAVRRGFVGASPLERMGIKRQRPAEKPEMTDAEIADIRAELKRREAHLPVRERWMTVCFEIALHQGCRLMETSLPMDSIDEKAGTITFRQKGNREFTSRLHDGLRPLMAELRKAKAAVTCTLPKMAAKEWHWLFKGRTDSAHHFKGIAPRLCFHCTRVTVITRLARAGVPIQQAMAYVGHADATIHRVYQRLAAPDLAKCEAALKF